MVDSDAMPMSAVAERLRILLNWMSLLPKSQDWSGGLRISQLVLRHDAALELLRQFEVFNEKEQEIKDFLLDLAASILRTSDMPVFRTTVEAFLVSQGANPATHFGHFISSIKLNIQHDDGDGNSTDSTLVSGSQVPRSTRLPRQAKTKTRRSSYSESDSSVYSSEDSSGSSDGTKRRRSDSASSAASPSGGKVLACGSCGVEIWYPSGKTKSGSRSKSTEATCQACAITATKTTLSSTSQQLPSTTLPSSTLSSTISNTIHLTDHRLRDPEHSRPYYVSPPSKKRKRQPQSQSPDMALIDYEQARKWDGNWDRYAGLMELSDVAGWFLE